MQEKDLSIVVEKQISKVWCGYAAFLFVELGPLFTVIITSKKGNYSSERGEYTIMIDGNWNIYKDSKRVVNGLESSYSDIDACKKISLDCP